MRQVGSYLAASVHLTTFLIIYSAKFKIKSQQSCHLDSADEYEVAAVADFSLISFCYLMVSLAQLQKHFISLKYIFFCICLN